MSIEREGGKITIECDTPNCSRSFEGERGAPFADVWKQAQAEGWKARGFKGGWVHGCPVCGQPR